MTRRPAALRHRDSDPGADPATDPETALAELLVAFHHPVRRWLCELLGVHGPANVGQLAARTELAVGSVSHHLKTLHRHGMIEPAPELARDTRESWWRVCPRPISWQLDDFDEGSLGRQVARTAQAENFRYHVRAVRDWLEQEPRDEPEWRHASTSTDTLVPASAEKLAAFSRRLERLVSEWSAECMAEAAADPDVVRRPVRVLAMAYPSGPVRP